VAFPFKSLNKIEKKKNRYKFEVFSHSSSLCIKILTKPTAGAHLKIYYFPYNIHILDFHVRGAGPNVKNGTQIEQHYRKN
jgi:hypothetical protein